MFHKVDLPKLEKLSNKKPTAKHRKKKHLISLCNWGPFRISGLALNCKLIWARKPWNGIKKRRNDKDFGSIRKRSYSRETLWLRRRSCWNQFKFTQRVAKPPWHIFIISCAIHRCNNVATRIVCTVHEENMNFSSINRQQVVTYRKQRSIKLNINNIMLCAASKTWSNRSHRIENWETNSEQI